MSNLKFTKVMTVVKNKKEQQTDILITEYNLLSEHYFHEDNLLQKVVTVFTALSGSLLAFIGSDFVDKNGKVASLFIPILGIFLCIAWVSSIVRIRMYRVYIEDKIYDLENYINKTALNSISFKLALRDYTELKKVRNLNDLIKSPEIKWYCWPYKIFEITPNSVVMIVLPVIFLFIWVALLFC